MPCLYIVQETRQEIAHAGRIRKQKKNGRDNELFLKKNVWWASNNSGCRDKARLVSTQTHKKGPLSINQFEVGNLKFQGAWRPLDFKFSTSN
jgi:hypothetical protein